MWIEHLDIMTNKTNNMTSMSFSKKTREFDELPTTLHHYQSDSFARGANQRMLGAFIR
ncbi:hypothetical protein [Vibrio cholerae]|uniref:hypothetical protein n=1 Tax=Vibrio cholerae TaxID=666 RepID=UPI000615C4DB|nr:hypothetical protein [Vibrio cholerae]AKB05953.1 putative huntington interacting protein HYPE [Vibrio cholerae]QKV04733.1 hypothetical protein HPY12_13080 [Vibrio cholerae]GHZ00326.1 putative huntington interacting protein HYPE [Vibrio cholerae]